MRNIQKGSRKGFKPRKISARSELEESARAHPPRDFLKTDIPDICASMGSNAPIMYPIGSKGYKQVRKRTFALMSDLPRFDPKWDEMWVMRFLSRKSFDIELLDIKHLHIKMHHIEHLDINTFDIKQFHIELLGTAIIKRLTNCPICPFDPHIPRTKRTYRKTYRTYRTYRLPKCPFRLVHTLVSYYVPC